MTDRYYALHLWDPATPGFCSCSKVYFGTEEELKTVVARMKKAEEYIETQEAILDYFRGNHAATHNIAYQVIPVLEPVLYNYVETFDTGIGAFYRRQEEVIHEGF